MKNVLKSLGAVLVTSLILTSCGPSPSDYTTETLKSTCDCVKMNTELQKNTNDLLEAETDQAKRTELQNSEEMQEWTAKKLEVSSYCSKNFEYSLTEMSKCPEYDLMSKELKRDHELHQSNEE
jgi:hypothetical protein